MSRINFNRIRPKCIVLYSKVQFESTPCVEQHVPKLQEMQQEVSKLCKRIEALEHVIAMANVNLTTLEAAVDNAEAELGISDRLFGMLNPLSFFVSYNCIYDSNYRICKLIVTCFRKKAMNLLYRIS